MKNVFDSRDVADAIEELNEELEELRDEVAAAEQLLAHAELNGEDLTEAQNDCASAQEKLRGWEEDEGGGEKLKKMTAFRDEVDSSEFNSGISFIASTHWVDYVQELVSDIGDMPKEIPSYIEIDWDKTAENVKQDYQEVEYDGETWYYRE